jgi:hypothetical protein
MNIKTAIEVKAWGDFDILYTVCVMIYSEKVNKDEILKEFYQIQGISSCDGLSYKKLSTITEDFIAFLELKGFKKLRTHEVYFSD